MGAKLVSEFLGTLLLVATVVGSGIMAETLSPDNIGVALLANTIATGAILYVLITVFGPVSGAHFNPAVTLAFLLRRDIGLPAAALFVLAQVAGGVGGAFLAHAMFDLDIVQSATNARTGPSQWLSEGVATFALVLTIIGAIRARPEAVPAAVALVIVAGYWFTASTSFANPAVTVGRAFTDSFSGIAPADVPAFIASQIAGALLAWLIAERIFGWKSEEGEAASLAPSEG